MGIQTMSSHGGGGTQRSQMQTLARQGSLYSLTLNEVQNQLGEPLSSMNLDELLKSVFQAEGNQIPVVDLDAPSGPQYASGPSLQRQASISMPQALSQMTVDEVWRVIQQGEKKEPRPGQEGQMTLGEMTLEDFLVKAGVVTEGPGNNRSNPIGTSVPIAPVATQDPTHEPHWLHQYHQMGPLVQPNMMGAYIPAYSVPQPMGIGAGPILDAVYSEGQVDLSSPTLGSDPQKQGRKRFVASGEKVDKVVERRQKRMMKNRESAARSRARKQAYTHELENKVSRLEEENEKLMKIKKFDEMFVPPVEPKYQLRRTSSTSL